MPCTNCRSEDARAGWRRCFRRVSTTSAAGAFVAAVLPNLVLPEDARPWLEIVFGAPPPLGAGRGGARCARPGAGYFAGRRRGGRRGGRSARPSPARLRAATGRKGAALYMPLRVALTGRAHGPELAPLLKAMPAGKARERLARFAA